jgi:hypothetical protein
MSDWFIKKEIKFNISEAEIFVNAIDIPWQKTNERGHNTRFAKIDLPAELVDKIEISAGFKIKRDTFFLWDYQTRKDLPLHIDSPEENLFKAVACIIPIIGRFVNIMWNEEERKNCLGICEYGPGDMLILNNRKYFHEGFVLEDTRLSLHFYSDFENFDPTITLEEMIEKNR